MMRSLYNAFFSLWITTFFLLIAFRIRALITWNFLLINTNREAAKILLFGFPSFIHQLFFSTIQTSSFLSNVIGTLFLFIGSFLVGILARTNTESFFSCLFFILFLFLILLFPPNFFITLLSPTSTSVNLFNFREIPPLSFFPPLLLINFVVFLSAYLGTFVSNKSY